MARKHIGKKAFDFSARVPLQLGRESISSSTVAASELIKNGYDADAEAIHVEFYLRQQPAISTLIIKDDGNGMNQENLYNNWFRIGTDNKLGVERSKQKQRVLTGAKGLGRLGLDRLCKKVILFSKVQGSNKVTQLTVDWRKYESSQATISDIQHDLYEHDIPLASKYGPIFQSADQKGTFMILEGLRDNWDNEFIEDLKQELRLLISPYRKVNDFCITLKKHVRGKPTTSEEIDSQEILKAAHWEVKASIDDNNRVKLNFKNNVTGEEIIQTPTPWKNWISKEGVAPLFGPLTFEFYYMVKKKEFFSKVNMSGSDWSDFMRLNRGVRIYRDDFRVRPYGEPSGKGDWLDIGYRKSSSPGGIKQGGWRIGPSQIIGAVSISKTKNSILNDQANREGIVENEAYLQLRNFILKVIATFENLAHQNEKDPENPDLKNKLEQLIKGTEDDLDEAIKAVEKVFSKKSKKKKKSQTPAQLLNQRIRELKRAKDAHEKATNEYYLELEKEKKKLSDQKDTLTNLASIGILTVCFGHEVRTHSTVAFQNATLIANLIKFANDTGAKLDIKEIEGLSESSISAAEYVDTFAKLAINNIKPDKRKRNKINVPSTMEKVLEMFQPSFNKTGIKWSFEFNKINPEDFNVRAYKIDWESITMNLVTNACWALDNTHRDNRKIIVIFERVGGTKLRVAFMDSGCGLETGQEEAIFLPMNSRRTDRKGNSIGTGMGLPIIKDQVENNMGGVVYATQFSKLGGAAFFIEVIQDV